MESIDEIYIEKDKHNSPFLLAASFIGLVTFVGTSIENGIVYWQFAPREKAIQLLDQFYTRTEPHIPARNLFEAIETFWKKVSEAKNGVSRR